MTSELSVFAHRVRTFIATSVPAVPGDSRPNAIPEIGTWNSELKREPALVGCCDVEFQSLALELFALQFAHNAAYRRICEARLVAPLTTAHWSQIPAVPAASFKELEMTSLAPARRTHVFHSSGTTEQRPSRHFHDAQSLAVYETSLWAGFAPRVVPDLRFAIYDLRVVVLTPPLTQAPHSSLVHMFECVRQQLGADELAFCGRVDTDNAWTLDLHQTLTHLKSAEASGHPLLLLGTAFSFVHLLDALAESGLGFQLPTGSRVLETGGYKGRSRTLPKAELHELITDRLGVPPSQIICEYGMSELSSQAYDAMLDAPRPTPHAKRLFHFPLWTRAQIISPESGREVADGETGLIRVFDLANVFSVMAIQTEDLAVRRGNAFELLGRTALSEPRGCSLMAV